MATHYYPAKAYLARNLATEELHRLGHADLQRFTTPPVGPQDIVSAQHYNGAVAHGYDSTHHHFSSHQSRADRREAWLQRLARENRSVHDWDTYHRSR